LLRLAIFRIGKEKNRLRKNSPDFGIGALPSTGRKSYFPEVMAFDGGARSVGGPMLSGSLPFKESRNCSRSLRSSKASMSSEWISCPVAGSSCSPDVMGQRVFDGGEAAVMHVGPAVGQVAQAGGLEAALVRLDLCFIVAAQIIQFASRVRANPQIVKLVIREKCGLFANGVAYRTAALLGIHEYSQTRWAPGESALESWP
jgi:hypothetical protein